MNQYNEKQTAILNELIEAVSNDTSVAINFLVDCFLIDEDEVNEMGCSEIFDLVESEISDSDFDTIKERIKHFDFENFDISLMDGDMSDDIDIASGTMKQPCKNPCPSCPYTKNAVKGYFGGHDPSEYANAIHQDTVIACHSRTKHDKETKLPNSDNDVTICTGHIVSQIKSCKSSQHPEGMKATCLY